MESLGTTTGQMLQCTMKILKVIILLESTRSTAFLASWWKFWSIYSWAASI